MVNFTCTSFKSLDSAPRRNLLGIHSTKTYKEQHKILYIAVVKCSNVLFSFFFSFLFFWAKASPFTRFLDHTQHHSRQDSSGRVISSSQRPLPDNTQHPQQTSIPSDRIRTHNLSSWVAADRRLRPRGHRVGRLNVKITKLRCNSNFNTNNLVLALSKHL